MSKEVRFNLIQKENFSNNSTNSSEQNDSDNDDNIPELEKSVFDTAIISIPPVSNDSIDASYKFMVTDERCKSFISKGEIFKDDDVYDVYDPSEIDQIINDAIIYDVHYYLVKWKKWSRGFNTWERFKSLCKSHKIVYDYINVNGRKNANRHQLINGIQLILSRKVISSLFDLFRTQNGLSLPLIAPEELSGLFNSLDVGNKKSQLKRRKFLISCLGSISLSSFRQQQFFSLKQWEQDINLISGECKIEVENNIDLEGPPNLFVYVTCYVPQPDIIIPDDPPIGCSCKKDCSYSSMCCNNISGYSRAYGLTKKIIIVAPGVPIFECNKECKCSSKCYNRVVQLGSRVEVCIYKTSEYGWGVKTRQNIQKGQFVAIYVGEMITINESKRRLKKNSSSLDCMWNLNFDDQNNCKYIIDSSHYANYTHFINHSCNENLKVYTVWINCLDRYLPQLALFACRDIFVGEQLTTNYFACCNLNTLKKTGQRCKCNMKNCRNYYF